MQIVDSTSIVNMQFLGQPRLQSNQIKDEFLLKLFDMDDLQR